MKRGMICIGLALACLTSKAFLTKVNYNKDKIPPYTLENPLVFRDGTAVRTPEDWTRRRAELMELFQSRMYGRLPPKPETLVTELIDEKETCSSFAIRRRVRMWFKADKTGPFIDWLIVRPKHAARPSPTLIFLNSLGSFQILPDKDLTVADGFVNELGAAGEPEKRAAVVDRPDMRGGWANPCSRYHLPIGAVIARGFAVVTACYYDIAPDPGKVEDRFKNHRRRCFDLWPETVGRDDDTRALMAWGWGLIRGMDLIEKEPGLDARRVVVTGCSRLGKAALLAGVYDERFAVVVPNQTGKGGAPLTKRFYGENVTTEKAKFPHWFTPGYLSHAGHDTEMDFDQHLLLACVAPRALLIQGFNQPWFDTEGEFLAVKAASPVWELLGVPGLPAGTWPEIYSTAAIGPRLGYVRRDGPHGLWAYDWQWMMDFAEGVFGRP